jgi:hypothetical protein
MNVFYVSEIDTVFAITVNAESKRIVMTWKYPKGSRTFDSIRRQIGEDHGIDNWQNIEIWRK